MKRCPTGAAKSARTLASASAIDAFSGTGGTSARNLPEEFVSVRSAAAPEPDRRDEDEPPQRKRGQWPGHASTSSFMMVGSYNAHLNGSDPPSVRRAFAPTERHQDRTRHVGEQAAQDDQRGKRQRVGGRHTARLQEPYDEPLRSANPPMKSAASTPRGRPA